jgi:hypothetical protein
MKFTELLPRTIQYGCAAIALLACDINVAAQDYSEGWYQIKRTVNIGSIADLNLSGLSAITGVTSLLTDVSYLTTGDEFTTGVTIPVINLNVGSAVYGAGLMDVDGSKDYTADLTSANGRNANEQYLTTYFYITPVGVDDDGLWRYTVRSANGHYMGPDGRYYVEPKEVYFNSSLGITLGDSLDSILNTLLSNLGVSIGSKQYAVTTSFIDNIPFIDRLDIYTQLKPLIEKLGDMGVKFSENSWTKLALAADDDTSTAYIGSTQILQTLYSMAQDSEQLLSYYNDGDYASLGRALMKYVGLDLFKLKKVDLSNITTSVGVFTAKHTSVTPYTVNIVGFGNNFSLDAIDYRSADALTKLSQKTDQNAMVEYVGSDAQANSITRLYAGGTLFVKNGGAVGDNVFEIVTDNGTDVVDLSRAQYMMQIDETAHTVNVFISSPKQGSVLGVPTGSWSDNYITLSLDKSGISTLSSPFALTIPADEKGLFGNIKKHAPKAYIATKIVDGTMYCKEITESIPANTPVIIVGDASQSYNFTVVEPEATAAAIARAESIDENILKYTYVDYAVPDDVNAYQLTADSSANPTFVKLDDENRVVAAWHAYYEAAVGEDAESIGVALTEDVSGVNSVSVDADSATQVYDLTGRPVAPESLLPGIYVSRGKLIRVR